MNGVRLYGPKWSAYVRTARLILLEKGVDYELIEIDFSDGHMPESQFKRHPFGKVPALEHDNFILYETSAIGRYIDSAFPGNSLQPATPRAMARMAQIIAILDAYLSNDIRMGIVNEQLIKPMLKLDTDSERLNQAYIRTMNGFQAISECMVEGNFLVGDSITLADLHAIPLFDFLARTQLGKQLIHAQPELASWWVKISTRPSVIETTPDLSVFTESTPKI